MRIPSTQKVRIEDFPDQKEWITPLVSVVNKFINDVIASVNGGIEFEKNVLGVEKDFDFVYISHTLSLPLVFKWTLALPPKSLVIASSGENVPTSNRDFSPIIALASWSLNPANEISISDIVKLTGSPAAVSALTAGNRYKIKVRITP